MIENGSPYCFRGKKHYFQLVCILRIFSMLRIIQGRGLFWQIYAFRNRISRTILTSMKWFMEWERRFCAFDTVNMKRFSTSRQLSLYLASLHDDFALSVGNADMAIQMYAVLNCFNDKMSKWWSCDPSAYLKFFLSSVHLLLFSCRHSWILFESFPHTRGISFLILLSFHHLRIRQRILS